MSPEEAAETLGRARSPDPDVHVLGLLAHGTDQTISVLAETLQKDPELSSLALSRLLPGFSSIPGDLGSLSIGVRAYNVLSRGGWKTLKTLGEASPDLIRSVPNCGVGTVREVLEQSLRVWSLWRLKEPHEVLGIEWSEPDDANGSAAYTFARDAELLVAWSGETYGTTGLPSALDRIELALAPRAVREAHYRLASLEASVQTREEFNLRKAFESLEREGSNALEIFQVRQLSGRNRPTLTELGTERGVSRERIRQLEGVAQKKVTELMEPESSSRLNDFTGSLGNI